MSHAPRMHPYHCAAAHRPGIVEAPRLLLKAAFAVLVHARAAVERKVWAEPRPMPMSMPPDCGPVVHHYRYFCLPPIPGQDCSFK